MPKRNSVYSRTKTAVRVRNIPRRMPRRRPFLLYFSGMMAMHGGCSWSILVFGLQGLGK